MTLPRRLLLAALPAAPSLRAAFAQPAARGEAVTILVPYSEGGVSDQLARMLAERLAPRLGVEVRVENRPGEGGLLAAQAAARAPADGRTLLLHGSGIVVMAANAPSPRFNPNISLAPVAHVAELPGILVAHPAVPARDLAELLGLIRRASRPLRCGVLGAGGADDSLCRALGVAAEGPVAAVVYRGSAPLLLDLEAGAVEISLGPLPAYLPLLRAGRLRALAVTTTERLPGWPDVPTLRESGFAFDGLAFNALFAPAGTPPAVIARLHAEVTAILEEPGPQAWLREMGATRQPLDNAALAALFRDVWEETMRARERWDGRR